MLSSEAHVSSVAYRPDPSGLSDVPTVERPAIKWPGVFEKLPIFVTYPYLLPCAVAALVTFTGRFVPPYSQVISLRNRPGSILSCFLGPDGGPRDGAIRLLPEKNFVHPPIPEEESPIVTPLSGQTPRASFVGAIGQKVTRTLSGYFASRVHDAHRSTPTPNPPNPPSAVPLASTGTRLDRTMTFSSRSSRGNGSAYGYTGGYRNRLASRVAANPRTGSMFSSMRRDSNVTGSGEAEPSDLNFAQRLLMANENAVTNIADLWVAAAMNVDNEDPFETDTETGSDNELDTTAVRGALNEDEAEEMPDTLTTRGRSPSLNANGIPVPHRPLQHRPSNTSFRPATSFASRHRTYSQQQSPMHRPPSPLIGTPISRRFSNSVPSIFAHPGVKTPSAVLDAQQLLLRSEPETILGDAVPVFRSDTRQSDVESFATPSPSLSSQLPFLVIIQYGALALHSTTHDQIFLSYLVSSVFTTVSLLSS